MVFRERRVLAIELPDAVIRRAKADAVMKHITLKQWWLEAALAALPEENGAAAEKRGEGEG